MNDQQLAAIKELWYTQPRHIKDRWLADPRSIERLHGLWQECVSAPEWIEEDQFAGIRLLERLDQGRNFLVLLGVHINGSAVCVKLPNYTNQPIETWLKVNRAIEKEVAVLTRLRQQAAADLPVPKLIDSGYCATLHCARTPFHVTEYWSGLKSVNRSRPNSPTAALELWSEIASAVGQLHQYGIVHGDLHEENIFTTPSGRPAILDFGSAQFHRSWRRSSAHGVRDFIPHMSTIIDEVALPHQRLTPAFDVFCLSQCMVNCIGSHFPFEEAAQASQPRMVSRTAKDNLERSRCFHEVVRRCSSAEPEFRLQSGGALAQALEMTEQGNLLPYKPPKMASARVFMRRYPVLVRSLLFLSLLLVSIGYFIVDRWRREHEQLNQQRLQSERLSQALSESNRASSIAYESMRELLSMTVRDDYLVPDQQKRWVNLRQSLVRRLALILDHNTLDDQTAMESLQTGLKLIQAHYEVDGIQAAYEGCLTCLEYCDRSVFSNSVEHPKLRLLKAQLLANAANIVYQLERVEGQARPSLDYARDAVDALNSVDISPIMNEDWLELYLSAAHDVLCYAIYPQRDTSWVAGDGGQIADMIFKRAFSSCPAESQQPALCFAIAQLHVQRARMIHKSAIREPVLSSSEAARDKFLQLSLAEKYLKACEVRTTEVSSITPHQVKTAQAVVADLAGLAYTQSHEYAAARKALESSLQWRELQLQQRPGSILCLREVMHTNWDLADTYKAEASDFAEPFQPQELYLKEIEVRGRAVERCRQLVEVDRCQETRMAHLVNALRLASAYRLAGHGDDVCRTLRELEEVQPLSEPGVKHGHGEDLLLNLAVLIAKGQASSQHEQLFESQCRYVEDFLLNMVTTQTTPDLKQAAMLSSSRLLKLIDREKWPAGASLAAWAALKRTCETIVAAASGR